MTASEGPYVVRRISWGRYTELHIFHDESEIGVTQAGSDESAERVVRGWLEASGFEDWETAELRWAELRWAR